VQVWAGFICLIIGFTDMLLKPIKDRELLLTYKKELCTM
jgi:hypothetical protein